ncbi:helix-turn-helix domain-containing protein [Gemella sp. GH3]|uniref:LexA family protein n=1 Tax=unclassified Gemella TaxID=2624949 RepID=UPI0015CFD3CF|nr:MULTISPECIES: S24 family peptidase [unclassified Gemella]MBF0713221.1 helix-turn-helix domain-containing protein [Gemella sp. GH3.1]NYS50173.1 helix-turn-helix domain-containing protein [Gemella sp. GH3]
MAFHLRLKESMKTKNIKQIELSRMTSITPSSISDWLKGKYIPKQDKLYKIAACLEVDPNWLLGLTDNRNLEQPIYENDDELIDNVNKIPILGTICAGDGVYAEEEFEYYMYVDQTTKADFALRVKGDSMLEAGILDGDIVFIRKKSIVANGRIAAVLLTDSNEASLKKFYKTKDNVVLQPCNSDYEPIITRDVLVIGECVGVYREI